MTLLKTSFLSLIATIIKMFSALIINKAIAIYVGPSGLAVIGQLQNIIQLSLTASQGAINSGITKYTAEIVSNKKELEPLISTGFKITVACSILVSLLLIILSEYLAIELLKDISYRYIFLIFGCTVVLSTVNSLILSILNGLKEITLYVNVNIIQSVYSLIFTTLLIYFWGLNGALCALVTNQSVIFLYIIWKCKNHKVLKFDLIKHKFDKVYAHKLSKFALMTVTSAILGPVSHLYIREHIGAEIGWDEAGYWQAMWYISTMYLMIATTTLSIYYLPRLSEIQNKLVLRRELINGYVIIVPIVIIFATVIFMLKDIIIFLLFSNDFEPMKSLFLWQLIGDVIKIISWLLSYIMVAKAMTKSFIFSEVLSTIFFIILSIFFTNKYGLVGMSYAFALNYLFYLGMVLLLVKNKIF